MRQLIKGASLRMLMDFVQEVLGDDVLEELVSGLSPEAQETFAREISNAAWYPFDHYSEMEEAVVKRFFKGDITYARKIGAFTMEKAYEDLYRLAFIAIRTPEEAMLTISRLWDLYHSPGRVELRMGKNNAEFRLTGVYHIPDIHKEHLCGWGEKLMEKVGARNPRLDWEQKGEDVFFYFRWEEPTD